MKKVCLFAFRGDMMCFLHVLINGMDLFQKGYDVKIVIEGEAVTVIPTLEKEEHPLYVKCKKAGIIDCICLACSKKLGVYDENMATGIRLVGDALGHPSMEQYLKNGFEIITL